MKQSLEGEILNWSFHSNLIHLTLNGTLNSLFINVCLFIIYLFSENKVIPTTVQNEALRFQDSLDWDDTPESKVFNQSYFSSYKVLFLYLSCHILKTRDIIIHPKILTYIIDCCTRKIIYIKLDDGRQNMMVNNLAVPLWENDVKYGLINIILRTCLGLEFRSAV